MHWVLGSIKSSGMSSMTCSFFVCNCFPGRVFKRFRRERVDREDPEDIPLQDIGLNAAPPRSPEIEQRAATLQSLAVQENCSLSSGESPRAVQEQPVESGMGELVTSKSNFKK